MKVLFVTTEAEPFIKTGGLADVSYALPKALRKQGIDVRIIMPKYSDIPNNYITKMSQLASFGVKVGWRNQYCGLQYLNYNGLPVYFVDNEYYFKRAGSYGFYDDGERFAYFCMAVMESVKHMDDFIPDVIHCNDWQTGIIPLYMRDVYNNAPEFEKAHSVYTIHNLRYQGIFNPSVLAELLGLDIRYYTDEKLKFKDGISFMKAGIVYADKVTTVSNTYAQEIQNQTYGEGLDGLTREKSYKLIGITNGVDYDMVNPLTDRRIYANYTTNTLEKKTLNKTELQKEIGLPVNNTVPLVGIVSRLVRQKGFDLITSVIEEILKLDLQMIILGTGDTDYQDFFEYYSSVYPGKLKAYIGFNNTLASRIYAGSDIFLMPSMFEPCGISQMISMRYGTVPLVRETGGLKDTVIPYNEITGEGNGFSFANYNSEEMLKILNYALEQYRKKDVWHNIVLNAMNSSYDWSTQAKKYIEMYESIINN